MARGRKGAGSCNGHGSGVWALEGVLGLLAWLHRVMQQLGVRGRESRGVLLGAKPGSSSLLWRRERGALGG